MAIAKKEMIKRRIESAAFVISNNKEESLQMRYAYSYGSVA